MKRPMAQPTSSRRPWPTHGTNALTMRRPGDGAAQPRGQRELARIEMTIAEALREHAPAHGAEAARRARDLGVLGVGRVVGRVREVELIHADARVLVEQPAARTAHEREAAGHAEREITLLEERRRRAFPAERARDRFQLEHDSYYTASVATPRRMGRAGSDGGRGLTLGALLARAPTVRPARCCESGVEGPTPRRGAPRLRRRDPPAARAGFRVPLEIRQQAAAGDDADPEGDREDAGDAGRGAGR